MQIQHDERNDTITIEGITYSCELFRQLGGILPLDRLFKVIERQGIGLTIAVEGGLKPDDYVWISTETQRDKTGETPELRQWAIEQAGLLIDGNGSASNITWCAQMYVDYVLRGDK